MRFSLGLRVSSMREGSGGMVKVELSVRYEGRSNTEMEAQSTMQSSMLLVRKRSYFQILSRKISRADSCTCPPFRTISMNAACFLMLRISSLANMYHFFWESQHCWLLDSMYSVNFFLRLLYSSMMVISSWFFRSSYLFQCQFDMPFYRLYQLYRTVQLFFQLTRLSPRNLHSRSRRLLTHYFLKMCCTAGTSCGLYIQGKAQQVRESQVLESSFPLSLKQLKRADELSRSIQLLQFYLRRAGLTLKVQKQTWHQNSSFMPVSLYRNFCPSFFHSEKNYYRFPSAKKSSSLFRYYCLEPLLRRLLLSNFRLSAVLTSPFELRNSMTTSMIFSWTRERQSEWLMGWSFLGPRVEETLRMFLE